MIFGIKNNNWIYCINNRAIIELNKNALKMIFEKSKNPKNKCQNAEINAFG
jgi:hypothetical protein